MKSKIKQLTARLGISATAVVALLLAGTLVVQAIAPLVIGAAYGGMVLGTVIATSLQEPTNVTGLNAQEAELEFYGDGLQIKSGQDSFLANSENALADSKQVALGKVQLEVCEAIKNGDSPAIAASNANASVNEYYSVHEYNQINRWNADWEYLNATAHTELDATGDSTTNVVYAHHDSTSQYAAPFEWKPTTTLTYENRTLLNGTNVSVVNRLNDVTKEGSGSFSQSLFETDSVDGTEVYTEGRVMDPEGTAEETTIDNARWQTVFDQPETKATEVKSSVDTYATDVDAAYSAGDLSGVDCVDPTVKAGQMPDDGSSALTFLVYAAAAGGYETSAQSNINITDETTGTSYDAVMWTNAQPATNYTFNESEGPVSSWLVGNTYNATDYTETIYIAYVDGSETKTAELDGGFTINSATSYTTGESVDAIRAVDDYKYKTYDATRFIDELQKTQQMIEDIESTQSSGTGGGLFDGLFDGLGPIVKWAVIGILGILGIRVLGLLD